MFPFVFFLFSFVIFFVFLRVFLSVCFFFVVCKGNFFVSGKCPSVYSCSFESEGKMSVSKYKLLNIMLTCK
jgi:hypothetical protein